MFLTYKILQSVKKFTSLLDYSPNSTASSIFLRASRARTCMSVFLEHIRTGYQWGGNYK